MCWLLLIFCPFREGTTTPPQSLSAFLEVNPSSYLTLLTKDGFAWSLQMSPSISCIWEYTPLGMSDFIQLFILLLCKASTSFCWWGFLLLLLAADNCQLFAIKAEATSILPVTDLEFQKAHNPLNESQVTGKLPVFFMSGISFATEITQSGKESIQEVLT